MLKLCQDGSILLSLLESPETLTKRSFDSPASGKDKSPSIEDLDALEHMSPQKRTMTIHSNYNSFKKAWDDVGLSTSQFFGINDLLQPSKYSPNIMVNCLVTFKNKLTEVRLRKLRQLKHEAGEQSGAEGMTPGFDPFGERRFQAGSSQSLQGDSTIDAVEEVDVATLFGTPDKGFIDLLKERQERRKSLSVSPVSTLRSASLMIAVSTEENDYEGSGVQEKKKVLVEKGMRFCCSFVFT